jgi:hypothetical protein
LPTHEQARSHTKLTTALALAAVALATLPVALAQAGEGGTGPGSQGRPGKAKLVRGKAIPPSNAPARVVRVIKAANRIAKGKGYCYGGGHGSFKSKCYDCSGSISYALAAAGLLSGALDSTGFMSWGEAGPGKRITVYANPGHAFMVVDGRRYDTSALSGGGTRWSNSMRSTAGFVARHPPGL